MDEENTPEEFHLLLRMTVKFYMVSKKMKCYVYKNVKHLEFWNDSIRWEEWFFFRSNDENTFFKKAMLKKE